MRRQVVLLLVMMISAQLSARLLTPDKNSGERILDIQMMLDIRAPEDTSITATMRGCWGMIVLDTATVISHPCLGPITWEVQTPFDTLFTNGGKAFFRLGTHEVRYIARDTCGGVARDTMMVTVIDSVPPIAKCVGPRTVSLNGSGMATIPAHVFDGGSIESCFLYFKVKRLIPDTINNCTTADNPDFMFDDEVKFCCTDIGDTIDVILKVYDRRPPSGPVEDTLLMSHSDTCITQVIILDKAPPVIICPPNITIECGDHIDFDTLGLPTYTDNCDSIRFEFTIERDINQCGTGEYRRVIVGTDGGGQTDTCIQTITVINNTSFDGLDSTQLKWPPAFVTIYDCDKVPDTAKAGGTVIYEDFCSMISVSWKDEVYKFSRGGVCSKVIRNWKVLDWCTYDPKVDSECRPDNGCWTFEQIIKVIDTIPPIITHPADSTVDYLQRGCDSMMVVLDSATTDRCYPGEEVSLFIKIDFHRDGSVDREIIGGDPSGIYPIGKHWIIYIAFDDCGNTTIDTLNLTVKDRVLPTPIAKNGLSTSVSDMGGGMIMVSIFADQLNASSYDNCTPSDKLLFSFSPNVNNVTRTYNCDSVGIRDINLWVTDECGNQDFARLKVRIEDPFGHCPTTANSTYIAGLVQRHDGMGMKDVDVHLFLDNQERIQKTSETGEYFHADLERQKNYVVKPQFNIDPLDGITTKDILLIHRFLLGKVDFDQTYQFLAADVDRSGFISARDITELRKLLLGKTVELKHGHEWIFMPGNFKFKDALSPLDEVWPNKFSISNIDDPVSINFNAFRIGDLDMSYGGLDNNVARSSSMQVEIVYEEDGTINLLMAEEAWLDAVQLEIQVNGDAQHELELYSELEDWSDEHFFYDEEKQTIRIIWTSKSEGIWMPKGGRLFTCIPDGDKSDISLHLKNNGIKNVIYQGLEEFDLEVLSDVLTVGDIQIGVHPNPFANQSILKIYSQEDGPCHVQIRNLLGNMTAELKVHLEMGWNEVVLGTDHFPSIGIYFIEVSTGSGESELKVVRGI